MTKKSFPQAVCETRLFLPTYTQLVEKKIIFGHTMLIQLPTSCVQKEFFYFFVKLSTKVRQRKELSTTRN